MSLSCGYIAHSTWLTCFVVKQGEQASYESWQRCGCDCTWNEKALVSTHIYGTVKQRWSIAQHLHGP